MNIAKDVKERKIDLINELMYAFAVSLFSLVVPLFCWSDDDEN